MGRLKGFNVRRHVSPFKFDSLYFYYYSSMSLVRLLEYCTAYFICRLKSGETEASPASPTPTGLTGDHFICEITLKVSCETLRRDQN